MAGKRISPEGHKPGQIQRGAAMYCECGWRSATWFGKGATASAWSEWHSHIEKCGSQ